MDPEVVDNIREIGKIVEDCGRMLQTKRKRWFRRDEVQDLSDTLRISAKILRAHATLIPKK